MILNILVPKRGTTVLFSIRRGSGIVGSKEDDGLLRVDYEGNIYGMQGMHTYEERVFHAADRHAQRYPTVARLHAPEEAFYIVGTIDTDTWHITLDPTMKNIINDWCS